MKFNAVTKGLVVAGAFSLLTGCLVDSDGGGKSSGTPDTDKPDLINIEEIKTEAQTAAIDTQSSSIAQTASQNTVTVVAAYATDCEVMDEAGVKGVELTTAPGLYAFLTAITGAVTASDCTNPVTGSKLPPLKTPAGKTVITPITTLVADGATEDEVKAFIGDSSADIYADPIVEVSDNAQTALLKASAKISAIIEAAAAKVDDAAKADAAEAAFNQISDLVDSGSDVTDETIATATGVDQAVVAAIGSTVDAGSDAAQIEAAIKVAKDNADDADKITFDEAQTVAESQAVKDAVVTKAVEDASAQIQEIVKSVVTALVGGTSSDLIPDSVAQTITTAVSQAVQDAVDAAGGATGSASDEGES